LLFTEPYISTPIVIFTRQEITYVGDLEELNGQAVSVVDGYAIHEWLSRDHPDIDLVPVATIQEGLDKLQDGEIIAFVGNLVTVSYYITEAGYTTLKVAGETPYTNDLSMAVRKDWGEIFECYQRQWGDKIGFRKIEIGFSVLFDRCIYYAVHFVIQRFL